MNLEIRGLFSPLFYIYCCVSVSMKCDTCHKKVKKLYRVVIDTDYNAINKIALWNCKVCYDKKNKERLNLQ